MSLTLWKTTFKKNWLLLLIFFAVLAMYLTVMVSMYDPTDMSALDSIVDLFPEGILKAFGMADIQTELTAYLANWLYGLLMIAFPMIYSILLSNKLVAKMVDNGSFAYLLSTPNSRVKIILTQGLYALSSLVLLFLAVFGLGVGICEIMQPGILKIGAFFSLNLTTMLVNMVTLMISFFCSCLFNETKLSTGFGAGIPIMFLLLKMISGASEDLDFLKNFTIFGIYDPVEIVKGKAVLGVNLFFLGVILLLFAAGLFLFKRKRLPL